MQQQSQTIRLQSSDILEDAQMSEGIVSYLKSSGINDIQRYHSGLRRFASRDQLTFRSGFKSKYTCVSTSPELDNSNSRIWSGDWTRRSDESRKTMKVFSKVIHLVDPILFQQRSQILSYMPAPDASERDELRRHAISRHNQASVDATVCYILSSIGDMGLTPHTIQYLETVCGIASSYNYKITDDFMSYRHQRWFWSLAEGGKQLVVEGDVPEDICKWILTRPESDSDSTDIPESESFHEGINAIEVAVEPVTLNDAELVECDGTAFTIGPIDDDVPEILMAPGLGSVKGSIGDEVMDHLEAVNGDIYLRCPNIPVLVCFQEAAEGTMDELLGDIDEENGIIDDAEAEKMWSAWIFQIVAALSVFQKYVRFCHNDLHTNNIVWITTKEEFLYYKSETGDYYKVPTYGKIFKLIDFGRATCEIGNKKIMSSDFAPGQDAAGQYNWGPFYNEGLPLVEPNMSFDLCRLAVSLFDSICPDEEAREDSALAQLLWNWMLDDEGQSVLFEEDGEERFPGFELYIHIAAAVRGAVPCEQFSSKPFSRFKWKGKDARLNASKVRAYPIFTIGDDVVLDI
jgi:hypothetical protein